MSDKNAPQLLSQGGANCFACSQSNPIGLQIRFLLQDGLCIGHFTPQANHVGYDDVVHGGLLFTALDDVMANWLYLQQLQGFTAKANVRYRQAARIGEPLVLRGECLERRRRRVAMRSEALIAATQEIVCEADAVFMLTE